MHIFDFFRDIFSFFGAFSRFFGVKFGFRKSCLCKRNDKYEVWPNSYILHNGHLGIMQQPPFVNGLVSHNIVPP